MPGTLLEQECVFEFEGRKFESGGAYIGRHKETGRLEGLLYVHREDGEPRYVGSWGGGLRIPARFGREWRSAFGDLRQSVYFTMEGTPFYGIYYKSGSAIVRCREREA